MTAKLVCISVRTLRLGPYSNGGKDAGKAADAKIMCAHKDAILVVVGGRVNDSDLMGVVEDVLKRFGLCGTINAKNAVKWLRA